MLRQKTIKPQAAQKSLLLLEKRHLGTGSNHRSVAVEITGPVNISAFQKAMVHVIERHEMLRSVVCMAEDGQEFSIIPVTDLPFSHDWPIQYLDNTQLTASSSQDLTEVIPPPPLENLPDTLNRLNAAHFFDQKFDLAKGPLWRATLVKVAPLKHQFAMLFNHIMIDEVSIGIVLKDLSAYYNHILGLSVSIPEPIPSLLDLDFSLPSNKAPQSSIHESPPLSEESRRVDYWRQNLAEIKSLTLQTDFYPKQAFRFAGNRIPFILSRETVHQLGLPAEFKGFSHNQFFLAVFYAVLLRYSGETDICIGITSSNRRHECVTQATAERLVNCFFNSMPLRLSTSRGTPFHELLAQVKINISNGLKHQLPLDTVFQHSVSNESKSALSIASPFNVMLVLNQPKPTLTLHETTATPPVELKLGHSKFPYFGINLDMIDTPEGPIYKGCIEYNTDLFHQKTMERLIRHFQKAIDYFILHPQAPVSSVPLLLPEEVQLLSKLNSSSTSSPTTLVPDYFHLQALACPDKPFLVFHSESGETVSLTYKQVDKQTSQLANYLKACGVRPMVPVGISMMRSPALLIAMLAVLKAGGVVVTLETEPSPILFHKIKDTGTSIILADSDTSSIFSDIKTLINLDDIATKEHIAQVSDSYQSPVSPDDHHRPLIPGDAAYIMYTSGTSGETAASKGVMLSHAGFANLMTALIEQDFQPGSKVICTAKPTFDAIWYDVLCAIITKGELHLTFDRGRYSPSILEDIIRKYQINFGVFLPNMLSLLRPDLPLTDVTSMGASPHEDILTAWCLANPRRKVRNGLGHTETGICVALHTYHPGTDHNLVGRPVKNMKMYILNPDNLSLCPLGVPGEIYISGPGVAIGYVNNLSMTKEKFPLMSYDVVTNTFSPCHDESSPDAVRLYATGDYGCYQLQNDIDLGDFVTVKFMGRKDRQLKINGVRIELDQVESVIRSLPFIKDVVVLPNHNLTGLSAYLVPINAEEQHDHVIRKVKKHLMSTLLPPAAYPKSMEVMAEFPITSNGKVDLRALTEMSDTSSMVPEEPMTDLQAELRAIWADVLQKPVSQISLHHNFKELGGDSYNLSSLEVQLIKRFNPDRKNLDINFLTYHMTIDKLASKIESFLKPKPEAIILRPGTLVTGGTLLFKRPAVKSVTGTQTSEPLSSDHAFDSTDSLKYSQ